MSEKLNTPLPQEALVPNAENTDLRQGVQGVDLDFRAQMRADEILGAHMPQYNNYVGDAHAFVGDTLGMKDVQPVSRMAVVSQESAESWKEHGSSGGGYQPDIGAGYVIKIDSGRPKTDGIMLSLNLVHELAHSATVTTENSPSENIFYHEAIAGMAEYFAIGKLAEAGKFDIAPDTTLTRIIDGKELTIVIPGAFRRVDAAEASDEQVDSTQALIAAMVVGMGLKKNGESAKSILAIASRTDSTAYGAMRRAIAAIDPALLDDILQTSGTTDEIIKVAHKAQKIVGII